MFARERVVRWRFTHFGQFDFAPKRERSQDGILELTLGKRKIVFDVKYKLAPTARDLDWLVNQPGQKPKFLIAPSLSDVLVTHCRERAINCADLNGRLWVNAEGVFIDRQPSEGQRYRSKLPPPDLFQPKSSRLVRALLAHPERRWTVQELTEQTGLSQALVYRLVSHLQREAVVVREGHEIRLNKFDALLDQWVRKDDWRKRTMVRQYSVLTADLEEIGRRLAKAFPSGGQLAFTQWFAANFRHPYTTPPVVSAYVSNWLDEATEKELRARRVVDGGTLWLIVPKDEGVFRETQRVGEFVLACDVQIYLDLLQVGLRGPDQAQALREWSGFHKATP
ncbi:MAG: helix-turn-helix domain-containing protein [Verrucomicrobiia bacterium]